VILAEDSPSIYLIPKNFHDQKLDDLICERFGWDKPPADLSDWNTVTDALLNVKGEVRVAMVGKYVELPDAYKSLNEALLHAGITHRIKVNIDYIDAESLEAGQPNADLARLKEVDAILVPGGFGERGTQGKMNAIQFARENKIPYLGICLGMQLAVIEYARNVAGLTEATSTEFNRSTTQPLIGLITEWMDERGDLQTRHDASDLGGTMRLGAQKALLEAGSKSLAIYGKTEIVERHRHRYEVNNRYIPQLEAAGMTVSGYSADQHLVEMVEVADHPWFVACQFHPEFTSSPRGGHPLFASFVEAAIQYSAIRLA